MRAQRLGSCSKHSCKPQTSIVATLASDSRRIIGLGLGAIKDVVGEAQPRAEVSQEGESKLVQGTPQHLL